MRIVLLLTLGVLAGCGADGEPVRPEGPAQSAVNLSVTGKAEIGIVR